MKKLWRKGALCLAFAAVSVTGGDFGLRKLYQRSFPLTENQIATARSIFNDHIDYDRVRVSSGPISFMQDKRRHMVIGNTVYTPRDNGNFFTEMDGTPLMIHEITHVWQNQNKIGGRGPVGAIKLWLSHNDYQDAYGYRIDTAKTFTAYNMEQQAEIITDYMLSRAYLQRLDKVASTSFSSSFMIAPDTARIKDFFKLRKIIETALPQTDNDFFDAFQKHYAAYQVRFERTQDFLKSLGIHEKANLVTLHFGRLEQITNPILATAGMAMNVRKFNTSRLRVESEENKIVYITWHENAKTKTTTSLNIWYNDKSVFRYDGTHVLSYTGGAWEKELEKLYEQAVRVERQKQAGITKTTAKPDSLKIN